MFQAVVTATAVDQGARQRRRELPDNTGTLAEPASLSQQLSDISSLESSPNQRNNLNAESSLQDPGETKAPDTLLPLTTADTSRQQAQSHTLVNSSHARAASRRNPQTQIAAQQHPLARLVDAVLQLTNEKLGASTRIQRTIADEVLRTFSSAADESYEPCGLTLLNGPDRPPRTGQNIPLCSTKQQTPAGPFSGLARADPETEREVQDVYTHDLFVNNPTWTSFLVSSTDKKADLWSFQREETATSCMGGCLHSAVRKELYMTLSYPDHSTMAYWLGLGIIGIILLNTATFCVESIPRYEHTVMYDRLTVVDYVCMGIFTLEYLVRLVCCPRLARFLTSLNNTIDLLAILPFYIELMVRGSSIDAFQTRVVRLLRVLRVLRVVKCMPKLRHLTLIVDALRSSTDVIIMLAFLLTILLVLFGTIFYFVEPDTFDSIPQAMYYAQVTLTTTGYGDIYPTTPWGRFVAGVSMLLCMVVVSLPITVIGGNFSEKWSDYKSFRGAVKRSARVCPTQRQLKEALVEYEDALDDVIAQLQAGQDATERDMAFIRQQLASARITLERGGAVGTPPGLNTSSTSNQQDSARNGGGGGSGALSTVRSLMRCVRSGAVPNNSSARLSELAASAVASAVRSASPLTLAGPVADGQQEGALSGGCMAVAGGGGGVSGGGGDTVTISNSSQQSKTAVGPGGSEADGARGPVDLRATAELCNPLPPVTLGEPPPEVGTMVIPAVQNPTGTSNVVAVRATPFASPLTALVAAVNAAEAPVPPLPQPPPVHTLLLSASSPPSTNFLVFDASATVFAACGPKKSVRAFALLVSNSVVSLLAGKRSRASVAFPSCVLSGGGGGGADGAVRQGAVDPGALVAASQALDFAAEAYGHTRDVRVSRDTFAALAKRLRTNEVHRKLEKLEEQYRVLRGWEDELGPMADHMVRLRGAMDQLAGVLQEGVPEEERTYRPALGEQQQLQVQLPLQVG